MKDRHATVSVPFANVPYKVVMLNHIRWLTIAPQPVSDAIVAYALTRDFYREIEYREQFEQHCDWYDRTAAAHQMELQKMQGDFNLFGWFNRKRT